MANFSRNDYLAAAVAAHKSGADASGFFAKLPGVKPDTVKQALSGWDRQLKMSLESGKQATYTQGKIVLGGDLGEAHKAKAQKVRGIVRACLRDYFGVSGEGRGRKANKTTTADALDMLDI